MADRNVCCENCNKRGTGQKTARPNLPIRSRLQPALLPNAATLDRWATTAKLPQWRNCSHTFSACRIGPALENFRRTHAWCHGEINGGLISVLRDTGSNVVIVRRDLIPDRCLTGQVSTVRFIDNPTKQIEEAYIHVHTPYFTGQILAKCMADPLYDLILGNLPGVRGPKHPDLAWQPLLKVPSATLGTHVKKTVIFCRLQHRRCHARSLRYPKTKPASKIHHTRHRYEQTDRASTAGGQDSGTLHQECREGVLLRKWDRIQDGNRKWANVPSVLLAVRPPDQTTGGSVAFYKAIMKKARGGLSGHRQIRKITRRILQEINWPVMYADIKRFAGTSYTCQTTNPKGQFFITPSNDIPTVDLCLTESLSSKYNHTPEQPRKISQLLKSHVLRGTFVSTSCYEQSFLERFSKMFCYAFANAPNSFNFVYSIFVFFPPPASRPPGTSKSVGGYD